MALMLGATFATAQSTGGSYVLRKVVIASGAHADAATLQLTSTTGQPAAAVQAGGSFRLTGGFHGSRAGEPQPDAVFRNGFE